MTSITTVAELEALAVDAVLFTAGGAVQHTGGGDFFATGDEELYSARDVIEWLPITLYVPATDAASAPLNMTRCVADGCMTSHPLPPGSSWACPDHQQHITLGRDSR